MNQPILQLCNVTKRIGGKTIIDGVSFEVPKGEVFGFLGRMAPGKQRRSVWWLAVNHMAPFLLTDLLLDLLKNSMPSRIINYTSALQKELDFDDLMGSKNFSLDMYGRSKMANVLFTYELSHRLEGSGKLPASGRCSYSIGQRHDRNVQACDHIDSTILAFSSQRCGNRSLSGILS